MASPERITEHQVEIIPFPIVQCGCGCGTIDVREHEFLYSMANGEFYVDKFCIISHMAEESNGKVLWMDHLLSVEEFLFQVMEVVVHD